MSRKYHYTRPGAISDPVSSRELYRLAASGQIRPGDLISKDGVKWRLVESIRELAVFLWPDSPEAEEQSANPRPVAAAAEPVAALSDSDPFFDPDPDFSLPKDYAPTYAGPRRTRRRASAFGFGAAIVMGAVTAWAMYYTPPVQSFMGVMRKGIEQNRLESAVREAQALAGPDKEVWIQVGERRIKIERE